MSEPQNTPPPRAGMTYPFSHDPLPYDFESLEPHIDAETMRLHHDKHHAGYIDNLNQALEPYPELHGKTIEQLMQGLEQVPEPIRTTVRNQGGGHANHQFFWKIMRPGGGGRPTGSLDSALTRSFGSFDNFQDRFTAAALQHFGSGWAFLALAAPGSEQLEILTLPNQDGVLPLKKPGLLACDLWEHAYYLRYQNRRADYLQGWWNVVAWEEVNYRLEAIRDGRSQELGGPAPRTHSRGRS